MLNINQLDSIIEWFEAESERSKNTDPTILLLKASKKLQEVSDEVRQVAFQTFIARKAVAEYCPKLAKGYFTKSGIEQRTYPAISKYHASFFQSDDIVLEIGCGLGFDTAAIAEKVQKIYSFEKDEIHALFARRNLQILEIKNVEVIHDDFSALEAYSTITSKCTAFYADPARRVEQKGRVLKGQDYLPPLDSVVALAEQFDRACIKLSPINQEVFGSFTNIWVGFQRECKERLIVKRAGDLNFDKVIIIDSNRKSHEYKKDTLKSKTSPESLIKSEELIAGYVLFPHPALLAGSLHLSYAQDRKFKILPAPTALMFSDVEPLKSEFYDAFKVLKVLPYSLKSLSAELKNLGWNANTELKKKNFPIEPESFRSKLKLPKVSTVNPNFGVVIFTEFNRQPIMILSQRI